MDIILVWHSLSLSFTLCIYLFVSLEQLIPYRSINVLEHMLCVPNELSTCTCTDMNDSKLLFWYIFFLSSFFYYSYPASIHSTIKLIRCLQRNCIFLSITITKNTKERSDRCFTFIIFDDLVVRFTVKNHFVFNEMVDK